MTSVSVCLGSRVGRAWGLAGDEAAREQGYTTKALDGRLKSLDLIDIVTGAWGGDIKMRSWVFRFVGWKGTSRTLKN